MADVVASGILSSLHDRLTNRMVDEVGWPMDVGAELKKLEGTLTTIRDVLEDAEARQVQERALRGWLRRLKDVAYDIDDLLDEDFAKSRKRSLTDPESSTTSWMKGKKLSAVKSLRPLGQLPALKVLHLIALIAVKTLGSEFYGAGNDAFPALEKLRLEHMPELEEWHAASAGRRSFPRLSELRLLDCPRLKELPSSFSSVEQLYLCANSELLLSSLPRGAFPNLKIVHLANSYDPARPSVLRILVERLKFVKCLDFHYWDPMDDDDLDFIRCISRLPY